MIANQLNTTYTIYKGFARATDSTSYASYGAKSANGYSFLWYVNSGGGQGQFNEKSVTYFWFSFG